MMKLFIAMFPAIIICSCGNNSNKQMKVNNKDSVVFYPLHEYFLNEVKDVDNTPYYIYRLSENNGQKDSTSVNRQFFKELAKGFLTIDPADSAFIKNYRSSVFADYSTNSITLTYSAIDTALTLQNVTILLSSDGQKVKRVFTTATSSIGDSIVTEKSAWKTGEEFYINRTISQPGKPLKTEMNIIVWNKKD